MDAKTWYWTGALLNMAVMTGFAVTGMVHARRGDVIRHRRCMLVAAALVGAFIASYALKLALLGREDFATWSPVAVHTLRIHETCVLAMIVGGAFALGRAWRMRRSRQVTRDPRDEPAPPATLRAHRLAGRIAVAGAVLGLLTASVVWIGMVVRATG